MRHFRNKALFLAITVSAAGLIGFGCAGQKPAPGEIFPCAKDSRIEKTIAPEAELEAFSCVLKPWEGSDTLHFNVAVKNISDQPQRYRVNLFLDNGKAVGGLIPRQTKNGLVAPGETGAFVYPVGGMDRGPRSVEVIVTTINEQP